MLDPLRIARLRKAAIEPRTYPKLGLGLAQQQEPADIDKKLWFFIYACKHTDGGLDGLRLAACPPGVSLWAAETLSETDRTDRGSYDDRHSRSHGGNR